MIEDINEMIDYMQLLRARIRSIRVLLQTTRIILESSSPDDLESQEKRVSRKIAKNNHARKLLRPKKKNGNSATINDESTEIKKKHTKNEQYVLNAPH